MNKLNYTRNFWLWFALTMLNGFSYYVGPNNISLFFMGFSAVHMIIFYLLDVRDSKTKLDKP